MMRTLMRRCGAETPSPATFCRAWLKSLRRAGAQYVGRSAELCAAFDEWCGMNGAALPSVTEAVALSTKHGLRPRPLFDCEIYSDKAIFTRQLFAAMIARTIEERLRALPDPLRCRLLEAKRRLAHELGVSTSRLRWQSVQVLSAQEKLGPDGFEIKAVLELGDAF